MTNKFIHNFTSDTFVDNHSFLWNFHKFVIIFLLIWLNHHLKESHTNLSDNKVTVKILKRILDSTGFDNKAKSNPHLSEAISTISRLLCLKRGNNCRLVLQKLHFPSNSPKHPAIYQHMVVEVHLIVNKNLEMKVSC